MIVRWNRIYRWTSLLAFLVMLDQPQMIFGAESGIESMSQLRHEMNIGWLILAGCFCLLMKAGFTLAEVGLVRAKNSAQTAALLLGMLAVSVLGYWICGFAWMFGGHGPFPSLGINGESLNSMVSLRGFGHSLDLIGTTGFCLFGTVAAVPGTLAIFFYHAILLDLAVTIPTGAMLERWRFGPALIFGFIAAILIIPVYGGWAWGGGWLADLGHLAGLGVGFVDFAGSGVVHLTGGVMALAGSLALGPRIGKANKDGTPNAIPGHNVPMVVVGSMIVFVGWFGVNFGRTFSLFDPRIPSIAVVTLLAAASGSLSAFGLTRQVFNKPDPTMGCNGLLAGLVAISASCAAVSPLEAVLIGCLAGLLVVVSILIVDKTLRIDDPVGAISVHGVCGAFGLLCVGLFARADQASPTPGGDSGPVGFFSSGDLSQLAAQVVGIVANVVWVFPTSYVAFATINALVGNRVAARIEIDGLDVPEMGVLGYVGEETYAVRTAGQDFLATFGPGVPARSAAKPLVPEPPRDRSNRRPPRG